MMDVNNIVYLESYDEYHVQDGNGILVAGPFDSFDEACAELGISSNYTVENLCPECGNDINDTCIEVDGSPYGRPDTTLMVHGECYAERKQDG